MRIFHLFFALAAFSIFLPAPAQTPSQTPFHCGFDQAQDRLLQEDPNAQRKLDDLEKALRMRLDQAVPSDARLSTACSPGQQTYRIPIVVHLVHYTTSALGTGANLTDAAVINVIDEVNDRYRHASALNFTNPNSGVDVGIELVLATRDPAGNPTTGIVRHPDDVNAQNEYGTNNTQIAHNWDPTRYFNFYIVENICDPATCPTFNNVGGFAYFPTSHGNANDGAVFMANFFWSGLVAHEAGHYFGLYHTFEGGCVNNDCGADGDRVCDTPPKDAPGFGGGSCAAPPNNCSADDDDLSVNNPFRPVAQGGLGDITDGLENYMDYTASCWEAYTQGQSARMRAAIEGPRSSLLSSNGAQPFTTNDAAITGVSQPADLICTTTFSPIVTLENPGSAALSSCDILVEFDGAPAYTFNWTGNVPAGGNVAVTLNPIASTPGTHLLHIYTQNPNAVPDEYNENDAICWEFDIANPVSGFPWSEGFESTAFPPNNFSLYNPDNDFAWVRTTAAGGFGTSTASALFDNFNNNAIGTTDEVRTPTFDFTGRNNIQLSFDVAYARYGGGNFDGLQVYYSQDCGATWTQVFDKSGTTLATAPDNTNAFVPAAGEWRTEVVNLSAAGLNNAPSVLLAFRNIPGWGNNLYLDNINLVANQVLAEGAILLNAQAEGEQIHLSWEFDTPEAIATYSIERMEAEGMREIAKLDPRQMRGQLAYRDRFPHAGANLYRVIGQDLQGEVHTSNTVRVVMGMEPAVLVYPNPFESAFTVGLRSQTASEVRAEVFDLSGKLVLKRNCPVDGQGRVRIAAETLAPGSYLLRLGGDVEQQWIRLVKN